jgi:glycosyltransferase involved in cell wall biosynthesis
MRARTRAERAPGGAGKKEIERMRILVAHNRYREVGGEDTVFHAEVDLLRSRGHEVVEIFLDNREITGRHLPVLAARTVWSGPSHGLVYRTLMEERCQVAHFHNTFPQLSPSVYSAARKAGVPVVQTLQNYRLACPGATLLRDGRVCEACVGKAFAWPGVVHGCYRDSRIGTGVVAGMLAVHRVSGTWARRVDAYVALTEFGRGVLARAGLPAERIHVKPNCLSSDPGEGSHRGGYALFVGRLHPSKGIDPLLQAWGEVGPGIPLKVVGTGPLDERMASAPAGVEWLGFRDRDTILQLMRDAAVLVVPSVWYEGFPLTMAEAFATGLPVLSSRLGAMADIVDHGRNGLLFDAGSAPALAAAVREAFADPARLRAMGVQARADFLARYTPDRNYEMLMEIYRAAGQRAAARAGRRGVAA